jgi:hypothetical protein
MLIRICLLSLVALSLATSAHAQTWGDLEVDVVLKGTHTPAKIVPDKDVAYCGKHKLVQEQLTVDSKTGAIANLVIYLQAGSQKVEVHPDYAKTAKEPVKIDNKNCRFEPHVLPVWFDKQELELHNSDAIGHNSNLAPIGDKAVNPLLAEGASLMYKFKKKQNLPVPVSCNIHPWMKGYVVVRDNPYTVVTPVDGKFKLENIPVGKHEFAVWHEKCGWVDTKSWPKGKFELEIKAGENNLDVIKLDPKLFSKK